MTWGVTNKFKFDCCDPEWEKILGIAMDTMDTNYLNQLIESPDWLPGLDKLFSAFHLPLSQTHYILLGESPYPRASSANGYAFWDNAVGTLWSRDGLSKLVNKATSLRNWIKMLLVARGDLGADTSQLSIAQLDKTHLVHTAEDFFKGMMHQGILLLNASLVYSEGNVPYHARHWKPFMRSLFEQLSVIKPSVQLILFGKIAEAISPDKLAVGLACEHPYNVSFITNPHIIEFFKPLDLLSHENK